MSHEQQKHATERMTISGDLVPAAFLPWIDRHAAKLGLEKTVSHASDEQIVMDLSGPEELIDMMEMGCSLGPIDVWVETIERRHLP
ncbi:acylphosphatase [Agrobacterium tumefaciens]|uniref:acylphosphatase n=1 Tax=Agrobacterium tumefaciens TaxID=358 RepID=UPI0021D2B60B|nr:acylphosphatase [Agrobacterium tumefaciens]UXS03888.1 acylphosphatase [Agrobacterium tumefaciens]